MRRLRSAAGGRAALVALVAVASGLAWSLITPTFHVPDEVSHFAYAQYFAETGRLPEHNGDVRYSPEEEKALTATEFYLVVGDRDARPPWTRAADMRLEDLPARARVGSGNAQTATNNPPLYYILAAIPYWAGRSLELPARLMLMRWLSVALIGVTALACVLFLQEVLPRHPWAWTVGGLGVALQPLLGFISSGVQADALLYATSALTFLAMARVLRRGLTTRTGLLLGAATALGFLGKLNFVGLAPAVALTVAVGWWRAGPRGAAARPALVALGVPAAAVAVYVLANRLLWARPIFGGEPAAPGAAPEPPAPFVALEFLSYFWQSWLPRLPFMTDQTRVDLMPDVWAHGFLGRFGWLDTSWPAAVYTAGTLVLVAIGALAAVAIVRDVRSGAARGRAAEALVYGVAVVGLMGLVAASGYTAKRAGGPPFEQARYLLPLLPLYAAALALAARSFGPRWGPTAGAVLAVSAFGHDLFAQLLTIGRFYG